jgi:hypothetical protein
MGGSAYVIDGRLEREPTIETRRPTWLGRWLFGDRGTAAGRPAILEVDSAPLVPLLHDVRRFVGEKAPEPWPATRMLQEYLAMEHSVYVRGYRAAEVAEAKWGVEIAYSGCAGMGEVSARVATHWTAAWMAAHADRIAREYLLPFGFRPDPDQPPPEAMAFAAVGELGYVEYLPEPEEHAGPPSRVNLDVAAWEGQDAGTLFPALERRLAPLMAGARCRCQLCAPEAPPIADV